jgi:hypothetical protein
MLNSPYP